MNAVSGFPFGRLILFARVHKNTFSSQVTCFFYPDFLLLDIYKSQESTEKGETNSNYSLPHPPIIRSLRH